MAWIQLNYWNLPIAWWQQLPVALFWLLWCFDCCVALPSWCCLPTEDYPPYLDLEEIPIRFGRSDVQNYLTKSFEADIKATMKSQTQGTSTKGFLALYKRLFWSATETSELTHVSDRDVACRGVNCAEVRHCLRPWRCRCPVLSACFEIETVCT